MCPARLTQLPLDAGGSTFSYKGTQQQYLQIVGEFSNFLYKIFIRIVDFCFFFTSYRFVDWQRSFRLSFGVSLSRKIRWHHHVVYSWTIKCCYNIWQTQFCRFGLQVILLHCSAAHSSHHSVGNRVHCALHGSEKCGQTRYVAASNKDQLYNMYSRVYKVEK
jgi:hypothetical protein